MSESENQKGLLPLLILLIVLALAVVGLYFINRNSTKKTKGNSLPLTTSSETSETSTATLPSGDTFKGELACLPADDSGECVLGLLLQDHYYQLNGLSQESLTVTNFKAGDQVTITGQISQDAIKATSITSN